MKLLVISDIHSNIWALNQVLSVERNWDRICFAGDLVDYGTEPGQVIDRMREYENALLVKGNHDAHTVKVWQQKEYNHMPPLEYKWVHHNCRKLDEGKIQFLNNLPISLTFEADGWIYLIKHQYDQDYGVIESRYQYDQFWGRYGAAGYKNADKRCVIFGHTHRQCVHILDENRIWLNPGSVSYRRPDDPDKTAHYAVIENGIIRLRQVEYDRSCLLMEAERLNREHGMMDTELQDFFFFFGTAKTSRGGKSL